MLRSARLATLIGATQAALAAIASPAHAQEGPSNETAGSPTAETSVAAAVARMSPEEKAKKKVDLLIAPVPFSSPATGVGIAGGAVAFYNPNNAPQQWVSGGGIVWTSRGSKGIAAFHSMSLDADRFRINGVVSYFDNRTKFYGIGEEDGDRGDALELANKTFNLQFRAQISAFEHGYVGVRYLLITTDAKPNEDIVSTPPPPADQMHSTLSMLGPQFAYDTRDSNLQPRRGVNLTASWMFGIKTLGDSYEHEKLTLAGSAYLPISDKTVVATYATLCSSSGDVPYYDLCLFGSGRALRGYTSGRYRDRASWSLQGEIRHSFAKRWGGVAFFGLGGIAPSVGDLTDEGNLLPAGGLGVRYRPFKDNDVNLRVDIALGKDDHGIYVGIGEAF